MTAMEGVLDFVERGCQRFMKSGGGPLTQDAPNRAPGKHSNDYAYRVHPEQAAEMVRKSNAGLSLQQIAREVGVSTNTVARHTRDARKSCAPSA